MSEYGSSEYGEVYGQEESAFQSSPSLGQSFNIESIQIVGTPQDSHAWNEFDEHGLLTSIRRLKGEKNWEFRRRIYDVFTNRANSTYRGLVNGITRELGLSLYSPVRIDPKTGVGGQFLAPDPYIKFDGVYLYLYSDYANNVLDFTVDRYEAGGNYEHTYRLINFINTTPYFEATGLDDLATSDRSMSIINQSNRATVEQPVESSTKFQLEHSRIISGTISFTDVYAFAQEVSSEIAIVRMGDYYVDYQLGAVSVFTVPSLDANVRYDYTRYPFEPVASSVILHDINSQNFKAKMFQQILQDDGTFVNGLPTDIGIEIIDELLGVTPMYWGV